MILDIKFILNYSSSCFKTWQIDWLLNLYALLWTIGSFWLLIPIVNYFSVNWLAKLLVNYAYLNYYRKHSQNLLPSTERRQIHNKATNSKSNLSVFVNPSSTGWLEPTSSYTTYLEKDSFQYCEMRPVAKLKAPHYVSIVEKAAFSVSPHVLAVWRAQQYHRHKSISEEHTRQVQAFTFIYTHLADALFWLTMSAAVAPGTGFVNTHEANSVSYTCATLDDREQERGEEKASGRNKS